MKFPESLLFIAAVSITLSNPALAFAGDEVAVRITSEMASVNVMHNGKQVTIMRNQNQKNTVNPAFAITSRKCPPFCIQPATLAPGVETIGEIEMLGLSHQNECR